MSARMRREPRVWYKRRKNVRKEERNTCHDVKARQIYGLKRSANGGAVGPFAESSERNQRTQSKRTSESATLDMER